MREAATVHAAWRRSLCGIMLSVALVPLGGGRCAAGPAVDWLMREPVSLFDLGIYSLRRDLADAARWLLEQGLSTTMPASGAYYDWREQKIIAYITVEDHRAEASETACRALFGRLVRRLTRDVPEGTRRASVYLENLFLHAGPGNLKRPRGLDAELVNSIRFEVALLPPSPLGGGQGVRCAGSLDSDPGDLAVRISG
jgi:hypothetical protein